jgi:hypothetical protein
MENKGQKLEFINKQIETTKWQINYHTEKLAEFNGQLELYEEMLKLNVLDIEK